MSSLVHAESFRGSDAEPPRAASRATRRPLLLATHVASAVGLLGVDLALVVLGVSGARGAAPESVYPAARMLGTWMAVPLAFAALGSGLLLALRTGWGVTRYWWVTIKLGVTIVLLPALVMVLVPALSRVADLAIGPASDLLTTEQRLRLAVAPSVAALLLAVNVLLSVYKPRWRVAVRIRARRSDR